MKKNSGKKIGIFVLVAAVLVVSVYLSRMHSVPSPSGVDTTAVMSGDTADLVSFSVAPGAAVTGMLSLTGSLKGNYFFEATARGMLLDSDKTVIKEFPITASGEWMTTDPVQFTASVDTSDVTETSGYIRLANDNPSGDSSRDKFVDIPVIFQ